MGDVTLRELCKSVGVSRRAVQGYEKIGLVCATSKNKYGYLLYDESAMKRIEKILMFQNMGFTLMEIKEIIDAPDDVLKSALENQLIKLNMKRKKMIETINLAEEMIANI